MNLEWNVFYHDINKNKITTLNILKQHGSFNEYIKKAFKKCKTKDEFAEVLRRELMYYFWSKCEWELIIEITEDNRIILSPWCECRDTDLTKVDVTDDENFDWRGFAEKYIKRQRYYNKAKIDVYDQVEYMWNDFLDYVWNSKKRRKKRVSVVEGTASN